MKHRQKVSSQYYVIVYDPTPSFFQNFTKGSARLQIFGYIFAGSICAPKFSALSKIIDLLK